ncbi:MAG TPA: DUF4124 domain-containing protein [Candidatus Margulisiibacteriota bacterium]|nr:DUF4124 domain-containing protein [Candidatus Margulisiibacteriota bacterium]
MTHFRSWLTVAGLLCWCGVASGQTFYKWTDDRGIVHFSDSPPVNTKNVEERNLPPQAPGTPEEGGEQGAPPDAKTSGANDGPAHVVLVSRRAPRTGPSAVHVSGKVKNVGGEDARGVAVIVSAVDMTAGTPCLHEELNVSPPSLRPGETGTFDATIDDPCLSGGTPVDITASSE